MVFKKKALIIFPDQWLPYSPSILNAARVLTEENYEVHVLTINIGQFGKFEEFDFQLVSIKIPLYFYKIFRRLHLHNLLRSLVFWRPLKKYQGFDLIIGVDSLGYLEAKKLVDQPVYLSLEVIKDHLWEKIQKAPPAIVLSQSRERFEYLFQNISGVHFQWLPNAPIVPQRFQKTVAGIKNQSLKARLIYFGNISAEHGVESCIKALINLPEIYQLTLHGPIQAPYRAQLYARYSRLFETKRIVLSQEYLDQAQVISYLSEFDIGFCFYDSSLNNDFNYYSCPSGKLFNYLAAGVPIIGGDILGLKTVKEHQCGILISTDAQPADIIKAIHSIELQYDFFEENCYQAAETHDFRIHFKSFLEKKSNKQGNNLFKNF